MGVLGDLPERVINVRILKAIKFKTASNTHSMPPKDSLLELTGKPIPPGRRVSPADSVVGPPAVV